MKKKKAPVKRGGGFAEGPPSASPEWKKRSILAVEAPYLEMLAKEKRAHQIAEDQAVAATTALQTAVKQREEFRDERDRYLDVLLALAGCAKFKACPICKRRVKEIRREFRAALGENSLTPFALDAPALNLYSGNGTFLKRIRPRELKLAPKKVRT
jgi:hypothetical protein